MSRTPVHGPPAVLKGAAHNYRLERVIARGGTGHFWHAVRQTDGEVVGIKEVLLPHNRKVAARVREEADIREKLRIPRSPRLHEAIDVPGGPRLPARVYLVQDLLPNARTLASLTQEGPATVHEILRLLDDVLEVLSCIHAESHAHGDVEPTNILRDGAGRYTLVDFGASALRRAKRPQHAPDVGPSVFLPAHDWRSAPSFARDLYALAICALSALSGYPAEQWCIDEDSSVSHRLQRMRAFRRQAGVGPIPGTLALLLAEMASDNPRSAKDLRTIVQRIKPEAGQTRVRLHWAGSLAQAQSMELGFFPMAQLVMLWRRRIMHHLFSSVWALVWSLAWLAAAWRWAEKAPTIADAALAAGLASLGAGLIGGWVRSRLVIRRGIRRRYAWLPFVMGTGAAWIAWTAVHPQTEVFLSVALFAVLPFALSLIGVVLLVEFEKREMFLHDSVFE